MTNIFKQWVYLFSFVLLSAIQQGAVRQLQTNASNYAFLSTEAFSGSNSLPDFLNKYSMLVPPYSYLNSWAGTSTTPELQIRSQIQNT